MIDEKRLEARKEILQTMLIHFGSRMDAEEIARKAIVIADTVYGFEERRTGIHCAMCCQPIKS